MGLTSRIRDSDVHISDLGEACGEVVRALWLFIKKAIGW